MEMGSGHAWCHHEEYTEIMIPYLAVLLKNCALRKARTSVNTQNHYLEKKKQQ